MHIEARLFEFLTAFFVLAAVVYGTLTQLFQYGGVEWAGVTALVMTAGLTLITGTFFRFVARRLDTRPEDYEDAEISDGAGELGFYSPHSWWPIMIALCASVTAVGVALWLPWLIVGRAWSSCSPPWRAWSSSTTPAPRSTDRPRSHLGFSWSPTALRNSIRSSVWVGLPRPTKWLSAACCRADEVVEKDRRK